MSYQAVIRDAAGKLVTNQVVGIRMTILKGTLPGTNVYQETQTPTTNANGLVTLEIGGGTGFDAIDWGSDVHFIKTETDPAGGTNYTISGTSQLLSVPYALYAETVKDAAIKAYVDDLLNILGLLPNNYAGMTLDIEGNKYKTVKIGNQIWLAENLRTGRFNDDAAIPLVTDQAWSHLTTPGYCWYNNDSGNKNTYSALYNWYAVKTGKLCPTGWHVPSDAEWTTLTTYLGGEAVAGGKMKETGTTHWQSPNEGATNESGFSCLPGGGRSSLGSFFGLGSYGYRWSSTVGTPEGPWGRSLSYGNTNVYRSSYSMEHGFSVRCLRDN